MAFPSSYPRQPGPAPSPRSTPPLRAGRRLHEATRAATRRSSVRPGRAQPSRRLVPALKIVVGPPQRFIEMAQVARIRPSGFRAGLDCRTYSPGDCASLAAARRSCRACGSCSESYPSEFRLPVSGRAGLIPVPIPAWHCMRGAPFPSRSLATWCVSGPLQRSSGRPQKGCIAWQGGTGHLLGVGCEPVAR